MCGEANASQQQATTTALDCKLLHHHLNLTCAHTSREYRNARHVPGSERLKMLREMADCTESSIGASDVELLETLSNKHSDTFLDLKKQSRECCTRAGADPPESTRNTCLRLAGAMLYRSARAEQCTSFGSKTCARGDLDCQQAHARHRA